MTDICDRKLDWKPNPDPRSALFAVTRPALITPRTSRYWSARQILDQGVEGACVGHGVTGAITASPIRLGLRYPQDTAFGMYYGSRRIDEWEGESYDGTSVNAGMKLARELGFISGWEWCQTPDGLKATVLEQGPVVVGMWLNEGFRQPDAEGLVDLTGPIIGGHCMYVTAFTARRVFSRYTGPVYQLANSWGTGWGRRGFLYLRAADLEVQFALEGEFAVPRK
jgi:hypothetical protein